MDNSDKVNKNNVIRNRLHPVARNLRKHPIIKPANDPFYTSLEWRRLRYRVLEQYGSRCMACGRSPHIHGVVVHVDHIIPRSIRPDLELNYYNLQILCECCNLGKGNKYQVDHRPRMPLEDWEERIIYEATKHI